MAKKQYIQNIYISQCGCTEEEEKSSGISGILIAAIVFIAVCFSMSGNDYAAASAGAERVVPMIEQPYVFPTWIKWVLGSCAAIVASLIGFGAMYSIINRSRSSIGSPKLRLIAPRIKKLLTKPKHESASLELVEFPEKLEEGKAFALPSSRPFLHSQNAQETVYERQ